MPKVIPPTNPAGRRIVRQTEANPGVEDHAFVDLIGDRCQREQSPRLGIVPADAADLTLQAEAPGQAVGSRKRCLSAG